MPSGWRDLFLASTSRKRSKSHSHLIIISFVTSKASFVLSKMYKCEVNKKCPGNNHAGSVGLVDLNLGPKASWSGYLEARDELATLGPHGSRRKEASLVGKWKQGTSRNRLRWKRIRILVGTRRVRVGWRCKTIGHRRGLYRVKAGLVLCRELLAWQWIHLGHIMHSGSNLH